MNTKKDANNLFFIVVLLALLASIGSSYMAVKGVKINIIVNLLFSQMIIFVPGLIFYIIKNKDTEVYKPFKKIKPVTVLLAIIMTWLFMPLVTCANLFSQLFTKNEIVNISSEVLDIPLLPMIFIIGILGPFSEEFVFRGLIYNGIRGQGKRYIASGLLSGLFFGLMHLNFNQFCYAFVLGTIFALVNECLDSIWISFVSHAVVNTQNVLMLYAADRALKEFGGMSVADAYNQAAGAEGGVGMNAMYIVMLYVFLFIALITTSLAVLLVRAMCKIEGKLDRFYMVLRPKRYRKLLENDMTVDEDGAVSTVIDCAEVDDEGIASVRDRLLYPCGVAAIIVCIFVMFCLEPLLNMIK